MPSPLATAPAPLALAQDRFIQAWGQMAGAWGIGRTMAEAHALLYIVGAPLNTDDVMARLHISRGSASTTLRALLDWGLVTRAHKPGDRKEYFVADPDAWSILRTIIRERKKRELDPLLASLRDIRAMTDQRGARRSDDDALLGHARRIDAMLEFIDILDRLAERIVGPDSGDLRAASGALADAMEQASPAPASRGRPGIGAGARARR